MSIVSQTSPPIAPLLCLKSSFPGGLHPKKPAFVSVACAKESGGGLPGGGCSLPTCKARRETWKPRARVQRRVGWRRLWEPAGVVKCSELYF